MGILDKLKKNKKKKDEQIASMVSDTQKTQEKKAPKKTTKTKKDTKPAEEKVTAAATGKTGNAYKVLLRPFISEKALKGEGNSVYTFEVARDATKVMVKQAVNQVYGIMPKKVRMMNMDGKKVRFGRTRGRRKDWKKAMVTLPKGKSINIHEGV